MKTHFVCGINYFYSSAIKVQNVVSLRLFISFMPWYTSSNYFRNIPKISAHFPFATNAKCYSKNMFVKKLYKLFTFLK